MEREEVSFQTEPGPAGAGAALNTARSRTTGQAARGHLRRLRMFALLPAPERNLKIDEHGLVILDSCIKFSFGFGVAHAHELAGQTVSEHLDAHVDAQGAILDHSVHH